MDNKKMVATFCVPYKSIYTFFNVLRTWNYVSIFTVYTKIGHFWQFCLRLGTLGKFPKKAILIKFDNFSKTRSFLMVTFFA